MAKAKKMVRAKKTGLTLPYSETFAKNPNWEVVDEAKVSVAKDKAEVTSTTDTDDAPKQPKKAPSKPKTKVSESEDDFDDFDDLLDNT